MSDPLHPGVATLLRDYARELDGLSPSISLDARIGQLVASRVKKEVRSSAARGSFARGALAAGVAALAVAVGVVIGMRLERATAPPFANNGALEPAWPPPDFAMWPTDSVALKIPVEVSPSGALVAVDGKSNSGGARYWVDIVVSNDGTVRIENIVPAGESHGISLQNP